LKTQPLADQLSSAWRGKVFAMHSAGRAQLNVLTAAASSACRHKSTDQLLQNKIKRFLSVDDKENWF
jgi:hypothetical protein